MRGMVVAVMAVALVQGVVGVMWEKRLSRALFPRGEQVYSDCAPGFLCINLGRLEEMEMDEEVEQFFQPAAAIVPQQGGGEVRCQTHTVVVGGRCWVLCDRVKLWPCTNPLLRCATAKG